MYVMSESLSLDLIVSPVRNLGNVAVVEVLTRCLIISRGSERNDWIVPLFYVFDDGVSMVRLTNRPICVVNVHTHTHTHICICMYKIFQ